MYGWSASPIPDASIPPMCPPLSCCHRWGTHPSPLRRQLYYLVRLLLASGSDEVPTTRRAALETRLDTLWNCLYSAMRQYYRVPQSRAEELTGQVVHALLREACCRQSVRDNVSLEEALSLAEAPEHTPPRLLASPASPHLWSAQVCGGAPYGGALPPRLR
jgi:hypothetical protein